LTSTTTPAPRGAKTISRDHLKQMIDRSMKFTLIEVLDAEQFADFHLPGAINVPLDDTFEQAMLAAVPNKNRKIVVYCGEKACDRSYRAAAQLGALGYTRVRDFTLGKQGWLTPLPPTRDAADSPE
jgi:rhodanese-related sulfurtransferase